VHKIVISVTGASGSIYAKLLLQKLLAAKDQWQEVAVVMTENAKEVWRTELQDMKICRSKFIQQPTLQHLLHPALVSSIP
jgi:3-polyprenyl-4-hydroxybenzoate decarboxylase